MIINLLVSYQWWNLQLNEEIYEEIVMKTSSPSSLLCMYPIWLVAPQASYHRRVLMIQDMSYSGWIWLITSMSILCCCLYYDVSRSELRFTASLIEINVLKFNEYERVPKGRLDWFSLYYLRSCIIRTCS